MGNDFDILCDLIGSHEPELGSNEPRLDLNEPRLGSNEPKLGSNLIGSNEPDSEM
ncbi:hypothetical protein C2G38_2172227 [Gigaspora rosea]|uniref:Uncharacterized protein n=1 Tax=Gigaspora rosea TaxID=44941 RepID=A0A397VMS0_9GLOM|nr:hypothetical protein C2G38_2172227 [Gigaspora rosea]